MILNKWPQIFLVVVICVVPVFTSAQTNSAPLFRSCPAVTVRLSNGSSHSQVIALKKFLVAEGVMGPNEYTKYFGPLTQAALQKWQCKKGIVCSGTPSSTGYGVAGPLTRAALKNCTVSSDTNPKGPNGYIDSAGIPFIQAPVSSGTSGSGSINTPATAYSWNSGAWSACINNSQARTVACLSSQNQTVADTFCTQTKPSVSQSCVAGAQPFSCTFVGQFVAHGASVTAYQSASVASGNQCVSEQRICTDGVLSGSYVNAACAANGATCTLVQPQIQTLACPAGQTGMMVQTRTSSCPVGGSTPVWNAWTTTSNTCTTVSVASQSPYPEITHTPIIGIYYFGIWSPAMFADSTVPPNNAAPAGTVAQPLWWAGVEDFFLGVGNSYASWSQTPNPVFTDRKPLIGFYNVKNVSVVESHIDQASAASVDFFNFYWYWSSVKHGPSYADGLESFKSAGNKSKMRFSLSIYTSPSNPDFKIPASDIDASIVSLYSSINDPAYLRVDGHPVISVGDAHGIGAGGVADLNAYISKIKQYASDHGLPAPTVLIAPGAVDAWQSTNADGFQCLTPGTQGVASGDNYDTFLANIDGFYSQIGSLSKPLAPCAMSNIDERPRKIFAPDAPLSAFRYYMNFTPYKFYSGMQRVAAWQKTQSSSISKILSIYAWNEWQEGGYLEPNTRDQDLLLNLVQRAFRTVALNRYTSPTGHRVTTANLTSPWVLEGMWRIFKEQNQTQNRTALYECEDASGHRYVSTSSNCDGVGTSQLLGYAAAGQSDVQGLVPLYGCAYGADRFVSSTADCGASENPGLNIGVTGLLGYVFPY